MKQVSLMQFNTPLIEGVLVKRDKRWLNKIDKSVDGKEIKRSQSQHYLNQAVFSLADSATFASAQAMVYGLVVIVLPALLSTY